MKNVVNNFSKSDSHKLDKLRTWPTNWDLESYYYRIKRKTTPPQPLIVAVVSPACQKKGFFLILKKVLVEKGSKLGGVVVVSRVGVVGSFFTV